LDGKENQPPTMAQNVTIILAQKRRKMSQAAAIFLIFSVPTDLLNSIASTTKRGQNQQEMAWLRHSEADETNT